MSAKLLTVQSLVRTFHSGLRWVAVTNNNHCFEEVQAMSAGLCTVLPVAPHNYSPPESVLGVGLAMIVTDLRHTPTLLSQSRASFIHTVSMKSIFGLFLRGQMHS